MGLNSSKIHQEDESSACYDSQQESRMADGTSNKALLAFL